MTYITTPTTADEILSALDSDVYALCHLMEFEHTIIVHEDGTVTDAPRGERAYWAPELHEGELQQYPADGPWSLMGGYTGQQGGGDTMHNSEFIGGRMARDILETPGVYVAVVCTWDPREEDGDDPDETVIEGWAVARREIPE